MFLALSLNEDGLRGILAIGVSSISPSKGVNGVKYIPLPELVAAIL